MVKMKTNLHLRTDQSTVKSVLFKVAACAVQDFIVDGNYIDNLLKAERERTEAEQKKENTPEQPIKQTINRKMHRR